MSGTLYKYVHKNVSAATLTSSDSDFENLEQVVSLSGNKKDLGEEVNIQGHLEQQTVSIQVNKEIWSSRQGIFKEI